MFQFLCKFRTTEQDRGFAVAPEVTVRVHGEGAVFLHATNGIVYSCNRVGAQIWKGLREGRSLGAIAGDIAQEYGVSADFVSRDAGQFVADLKRVGILVRGGHGLRV
jgi:hypothetical protein